MNTYLRIKQSAKMLRWQLRRASNLVSSGGRLNQMPIVIGNSMPKSGSHLIIQILEGLTRIGPFVNPGMPPLNRDEDNSILSPDEVCVNIARLRHGDIAYCYLPAVEPYFAELTKPDRAVIFVYRDPRDVIISHVFYATEMNTNHNMHKYYTETLGSMDERIRAAILGVDLPTNPLSPIALKYQRYLPWLDQQSILAMRFEDLILDRENALKRILDYLSRYNFIPSVDNLTAINLLTKAIEPKRSGTFRKGKPGNWRDYFTDELIDIFKNETGDLLQRLGYESSQDW